MKISYDRSLVQNPLVVLRSAGYQPFTDPVSHKESFILRLTSGFYPRFHVYVKEQGSELIIDLHLDQKKPSYAGSRMHGGEYDGPTVEKEMKRIQGWVNHAIGVVSKPVVSESKEELDEEEPAKQQQPEDKLFGGIF